MDWLELKIPPVAQVLLYGLFMWLLSSLDPSRVLTATWANPVAIGLVGLGAGLALVAVIQFRAARTTVDPRDPAAASTLVSGGVFALSRNPMYVGFLLGLAGWATHLAHPAGLLCLPAFVLTMNRFQIRPEEAAMEASYGQDYRAYTRSTRRWI